MGRAKALFDANHDLVKACRTNRFVVGIADGTLARERFVHYVEQDAWFLTAFARAYALGAAKAPDTATMTAFRDLLDGVLDELRLHRGYAERWGADLDPEPAPATSAYTDFLLRVAWSEPVANLLAAMTPCMRLYADLGAFHLPAAAPDSPYRDWVEAYADPGFEALASQLESLLDRFAPADAGSQGDADRAVAARYRTAMRHELAFFEAAAG